VAGADAAAVCLLRMLRGMSSLSLLTVPCTELTLLLFCFLVGGDPSTGCLSRFSRTGLAFLEGLLVEVAAVVVVVDVMVVAVVVFVLMVVTVATEVTAGVTDFISLLLDFRFLDRETISDVDDVATFATGFST